MFAKLLKHDFKSTWGILGLLCLISLGAGVLGGGAMWYLVWISERGAERMTVPMLLCVLIMIAAIIFIVVCGVAALLILIGRFYKSRFTDEGYLTFTLPVTSHQILLSSMVSSALSMLIVGITVFASIVLLLLFGFSGMDGFLPALREEISIVLQAIRTELGVVELKHLMLAMLDLLVSFVSELIMLMLAVTIGALIAKKHKILAAVATYYGIRLGISIISIVSLAMLTLTAANSVAIGSRIMSSSGLLALVVAVGGYFLMHYLVSKKLNLN